ncbi:MAG: queuosine precursor transporter [Planctomycetota bacterium]
MSSPRHPPTTEPDLSTTDPSGRRPGAGLRSGGAERTAEAPLPRAEATYAVFVGVFMVTLVLTNVIGTKLFVVHLGGLGEALGAGADVTLTTGIVTYPVTFLLTDIVAELWGRQRANLMVYAGFAASLLMLAIVKLAVALPPSTIWTQPDYGFADSAAMQNAFHASFAAPGMLLFASMTAYLVAQLLDVRLYHFWWRVTGGKHMWLRNNGSTWISQLADTIIVNSIFLRGFFGFEWSVIAAIIWANYLVKLVMAALDTPVLYILRGALERWLGIAHDPGRGHAPLA